MMQTNRPQIAGHQFFPLPAGKDGVVAYIHIGDIHMVDREHRNFADLLRIVQHINDAFRSGVNFVYIPGDIADDGSRSAYSAVRQCVDELKVPWCGIVGDHDVHEKSFDNFREAIADSLYDSFEVGNLLFIRLNVFAEPRPDAFLLGEEQFEWLEEELQKAEKSEQIPIVLMHCYPSELKEQSSRLIELLRRFRVRLVDMGHTHYNEVSNDGTTLFAATRSTGQIEEGNVGYSLITFDHGSISWHFLEPQEGPIVVITSPADERLIVEESMEGSLGSSFKVRSCIWGDRAVISARAEIAGRSIALEQTPSGHLWESQTSSNLPDGVYELTITAVDSAHREATDTVRIAVGPETTLPKERKKKDMDNALKPWEERGLLGTQLGPNKNGRKW